MARFRFRLESLLRLATSRRDLRRQELAQALQAERIVLEHIEQLQTQIDQALQQRRPGLGPVDVDALLEATRHQLVLLAQKQHMEQQLEQVRQEIQRRRQVLAETDRQVRLLERLKEKQHQRHQYEQLRRQQQVLDEIANNLGYREQRP